MKSDLRQKLVLHKETLRALKVKTGIEDNERPETLLKPPREARPRKARTGMLTA